MSDENSRKTAIVVGASSGMGRATAVTLAENGWTVLATARRLDRLEELRGELHSAGHSIEIVACDVCQRDQVEALIETAKQTLGRIDLLVNCAAIWKPIRLEEVTAADVRDHVNVNTIGTFLCCQQTGLLMVQQESGGAIVNVGDWALDRPYMDYAAYFASKGAIPIMTKDFAIELASRNPRIRVNAILPGRAMLPEGLDSAERQAAIDGTLLKREGSPQHVTEAVVFLAEHEFITGVCLPVDGGRCLRGEN